LCAKLLLLDAGSIAARRARAPVLTRKPLLSARPDRIFATIDATLSIVHRFLTVTALLVASNARAEEREWCAPELETLSDGVCFFAPDHANATGAAHEPDTLVLFLHSLVGVNTDWQWEQQRVIVNAGRKFRFSALMPRGRRGIGPGRAPDVWAWPTAPRMQEQIEDELIREWGEARARAEARRGRRFERLLVFGFSNGAYYASSLALRGRLDDADGYGVFAGGSGGKYGAFVGSKTTRRAPIFVGYGTKDAARKDMQGLTATLKQLGWPHRVKVQHVGHIVTNAQLAGAFRFLTIENDAPDDDE
jgi:predicted esterase